MQAASRKMNQVKWYGQARPALISIEAFSGALSSTTSVSSYSLQAAILGSLAVALWADDPIGE
jgi:hypothetical protein